MLQLPFSLKPILRAYQPEAFLCGIVFSKNDKYLSYFLSHYIQLIYYDDYATSRTLLNYNNQYENWLFRNHGLITVDFLSIPHFIAEEDNIDFADIILGALHDGYYVLGLYDEYYIPGKAAYNHSHFSHDYLVYGVDEDKREFLSAGYLRDGFYSSFSIPFENYNQSLLNNLPPEHLIWFLKFHDDIGLSFDINTVRQGLCRYLQSYSPDNSKNTFGLEAIESYIKHLTEKQNKQNEVDIRSLYTIWEHKAFMHKRLTFMMENKYVRYDDNMLIEYNQIVRKSELAVSMGLKYNMTLKQGIVNRIIEIIQEIMVTENMVLQDVCEQLGDK